MQGQGFESRLSLPTSNCDDLSYENDVELIGIKKALKVSDCTQWTLVITFYSHVQLDNDNRLLCYME